MRGRLAVIVLASLASLTLSASLASGPAAGSVSRVLVSGPLPYDVSNPLVDSVHRRVFAWSHDRLFSYPYDLSRLRSVPLASGTHSFGLRGNDSALFDLTIPVAPAAIGRLTRMDPVTLTKTGSWREPDVYGASNIVFSHGLLWALVQRTAPTSIYTRTVLAALDPRHPRRGWRGRTAQPECFGDCFVVASPRQRWLAVVDGGSTGTIDLFQVWADRRVRLVSETDVPNYENGPYFSPDGASAVMDATYDYAPPDGFTICDLPNLAGGRYVPSNWFMNAAYTPDGGWISTVSEYGYSRFYNATDPGAAPVAGAHIPLTDRVGGVIEQGANRPVYPDDQDFFFIRTEEDIDSSKGSVWTNRLARYPVPVSIS